MIIAGLTPKLEWKSPPDFGVFAKYKIKLVAADQLYARQGPEGLEGASGLYVTGDATIPSLLKSAWQEEDLKLLRLALNKDMPILATGPGLGLLNQAFDGKLPTPVKAHAAEGEVDGAPVSHAIYLSPGSKSAAILGVGGFFKVTSHHYDGLREPQRSPRLLASAYAVEDGVIEGLESTEHDWVIGFQATIEREGEAPKVFGNVMQAFVERAQAFTAGHRM